MELYATITSINDPDTGWYKAEININPGFIVSGTSLKGSSFTVGERVRIYQFLFWGSGAEFGFAKESEMDYSVAQFNPAFAEAVKAENQSGFLLNWIAQEAGNKKQMFGAGKIHSFLTVPGIGNIGARVDLVSSGTRATLGFTEDLDPNLFQIGDGVLVSYWPNPGRAIVGWWQTVPDSAGIVNEVAQGDTVGFSAEKTNTFSVSTIIKVSSGAIDNIIISAGDEIYSSLPNSQGRLFINDVLIVTADGSIIPPFVGTSFNFIIGQTYKIELAWTFPAGVSYLSSKFSNITKGTSLNFKTISTGGAVTSLQTFVKVVSP